MNTIRIFQQLSVSHDPSDIFLICWSGAQENFNFCFTIFLMTKSTCMWTSLGLLCQTIWTIRCGYISLFSEKMHLWFSAFGRSRARCCACEFM